MTVSLYRFKYQVSDRTVFAWSRLMRIRSFGLGATKPDTAPPLGADCHGVLLRSVPWPRDTPTVERTSHEGSSVLRYVVERFPRYYVDMANQDFEQYKAKFSAKTRATLGRKVRKFIESSGGDLHWECFSAPDDLERFWQLARAVSAKTYQERLLEAGLPEDASYRQQALQWASEDRLRAFLLFHRGQPVSYLFCPIRDGVVEYAYLGYDPSYQHLSAGTVLQWLALEKLFAERRYRFFDFTEGESQHKRLFSTGHLECANVALLHPTLSHRLLVASHRRFTQGVEALGRWLEQHDLKSRVRRWLRFGLQH